jgi:hypothetical protein
MRGAKPQSSAACHGPDGSPAPMRAPSAVTSAHGARWSGPERNERRPGHRPERTLVTALHTGMVGRRAGRMTQVVDYRSVASSVTSADADSAWLHAMNPKSKGLGGGGRVKEERKTRAMCANGPVAS